MQHTFPIRVVWVAGILTLVLMLGACSGGQRVGASSRQAWRNLRHPQCDYANAANTSLFSNYAASGIDTDDGWRYRWRYRPNGS